MAVRESERVPRRLISRFVTRLAEEEDQGTDYEDQVTGSIDLAGPLLLRVMPPESDR